MEITLSADSALQIWQNVIRNARSRTVKELHKQKVHKAFNPGRFVHSTRIYLESCMSLRCCEQYVLQL